MIDDHIPRQVNIGAGTALKVGFFFALGVTLFSVVVSLIAGILVTVLGFSLLPRIGHLLGW
jgi:hypothetical protein